MFLGTCALALVGCGPAVDDENDDGQAEDSQSGTGTQTEGTSQSGTSGEATSTATDSPIPTGPMPDPTDGDETGPGLPECPGPEVGEISLEVSGPAPDFQGLFEARCTVLSIEEGDAFDAFRLDCIPTSGDSVEVNVAYGNAAVLLPSGVQPGELVGLTYVRADYELQGQWLALRNSDGELLLGIANGGAATPYVDGEGELVDFYTPLSVELLGGVCPKAAGTCFELGEPAALSFDSGADTIDALPFQVEQLSGFTIHTGASWLSDPDSPYSCDGPSDDWAAFVAGVP